MALFEILMPQLINCRQQCGQAFGNLMDQDWNHWKLQVQSWMEDANEATAQAGATSAGAGAQSCGSAANRSNCRRNRCNGSGADQTPEIPNPLEALHSMWTQFARPGQQRQSAGEQDPNNQVKDGQRKYVIKLDVQHFEPNEISVKIVDNDIVVTGEHPERTDRLGRISRKFQRKYELPADVEPESIVSTLTPSGVLIIEGLKKSTPNDSEAEIIIPVIREGTSSSSNDPNLYQNDQQMD